MCIRDSLGVGHMHDRRGLRAGVTGGLRRAGDEPGGQRQRRGQDQMTDHEGDLLVYCTWVGVAAREACVGSAS